MIRHVFCQGDRGSIGLTGPQGGAGDPVSTSDRYSITIVCLHRERKASLDHLEQVE